MTVHFRAKKEIKFRLEGSTRQESRDRMHVLLKVGSYDKAHGLAGGRCEGLCTLKSCPAIMPFVILMLNIKMLYLFVCLACSFPPCSGFEKSPIVKSAESTSKCLRAEVKRLVGSGRLKVSDSPLSIFWT